MSVSIIVLTRDEEVDLPRLLASIRWCDDLHVVDSGSTDATCQLARAAGAIVVEHPFTLFGAQRNWALANCHLKNRWALFLDADEASTPEFHAAMMEAVENADETVAGFYCCWKMMVEGRWLKHADSFPKWQFRLLRVGNANFTDFGHGQKEGDVNGSIEYLRTPYLHFALSKGWDSWRAKHERYAAEEAKTRAGAAVNWRDVLSRNPSRRNKALKPLVSRVPGWPTLRFLQSYLLAGGFLEGGAAFRYCRNLASYERAIQRKMKEAR